MIHDLPSVIGASDERPADNLSESERLPHLTQIVELLRSDVAEHRLLIRGWLQVLAQRHRVALRGAQVFEHGDDLVSRLAESDHETRLGDEIRATPLGNPQHIKRSLVVGARAYSTIKPRNGLDVVCKDIERRLRDTLDPYREPMRWAVDCQVVET